MKLSIGREMKLEEKCPICESKSHPVIPQISDNRYSFHGNFSIYQCISCRHCFTRPRLEESEISELYRNFYGRNQVDPMEIKKQALQNVEQGKSRYLQKSFRSEIKILTSTESKNLRILDFGSGDCLELCELDCLNFDVWGYDTDSNSVKIANEINCKVISTIEELEKYTSFYDYIQLNQVLEHFIYPEKYLKKIISLLKPEGMIHIETPNVNSIYRKVFKKKWINWHVPYHQHHFSIKSIEVILEECGYEILRIETKTPYQWTLTQAVVILNEITPLKFLNIWNSTYSSPLSKSKGVTKYNLVLKLLVFIIRVLNYPINKLRIGDSLIILAKRIQ